ncbi:MAG: septal ring lytic transglycosylase RlpA family protein [Rhodothermia bacterium]|nr:septal ring lytic transglycosylase RlpA family protein [Rhodothermia bacterium]
MIVPGDAISRFFGVILITTLGCTSQCASSEYTNSEGALSETGIASYYASSLDGRTTASGQTYDENKLTAAHRTLPFGARVRVTNLSNDRSVIVVINDRGPFVDGRIIDLSRRAARELDFVREGVTRVRLERLSG